MGLKELSVTVKVTSESLHPKISSEKKNRIVIVDDSADFLMLQKLVLEMDGYEVFTAASGAEALQLLKKIDPPNLILLDIHMSDMSGPDFLEIFETQMPSIFSSVPVVFCTGMDTIPKSKAIGFIPKVLEIEQLLKAVKHFIEVGTIGSKKL